MTTPRLYVDSADEAAVPPLLRDGLVHGVTTNPTILDRAGRSAGDIPELCARWASLGAGEIFVQAWGEDRDQLEQRARQLHALGDRIVVKVVATADGFAVASRLARDGAPVLLTGVYTVAQALAAASASVRYIAPYLGRMRDTGVGDVEDIARMQTVAAPAGTEVLAASLRTPEDVVSLAEHGITAFTASPDVLAAMLASESTQLASAAFDAADSLRDAPGELTPVPGIP
ncbi:MAG: transaldolase family protein [Brachybacterium sp.]